MGQSLSDFFVDGGNSALVVRLTTAGAAPARLSLGDLVLTAADPGAWGNHITGTVSDPMADGAFSLTVAVTLGGQTQAETFTTLSIAPDAGGQRIDRVLEAQSRFVRVALADDGQPLLPSDAPPAGATATGTGGADSPPLMTDDLSGGFPCWISSTSST